MNHFVPRIPGAAHTTGTRTRTRSNGSNNHWIPVLLTLITYYYFSATTTTTTTTTAFVTVTAWASSAPWSSVTTTNHHTTATTTCIWGYCNTRIKHPILPLLHRGGNQKKESQRNSNIVLSMGVSETETTSTTTMNTILENNGMSMDNYHLLSDRGKIAIYNLIAFDQEYHDQIHIYQNWPVPGMDDDQKIRLTEQLADLDTSYPGGLAAYLSKAKLLLKESADGTNPFDEYTAVVPTGEVLKYDSTSVTTGNTDNDDDATTTTTTSTAAMTFTEAEEIGLQACSNIVFVLVAGGLGERLGYSGIKLSLSTDLCTDECYLSFYAKYILALQHRARNMIGSNELHIPLVIMTSGDTDAATRQLLHDNANFGLDEQQVTVVMQDKVAALCNGNAGLALEDDDRWCIQTKPHGHGDVHHLLYREGLVDRWEKDGKTHVVFLQDTNALVVNSVLPTLGVSVQKGFHMNSICIPRLAGEAAGAIARLEHKSDPNKSLVINVEYNQLDPLLRTQGDCLGDVADPQTGYSPFPGNANNLIIEMSAYAKTLRGEDQGVVLEFVNPKYKDNTRTTFKKPTRLECMMQDIPKLFQKEMGKEVNIGFTMFDRWITFSPAKNSLEAGQDAVKGGNTAPGTLSSAESDMYVQNQKKLHTVVGSMFDLSITDYDSYVPMAGIPVTPGPRIILCPAFAICQKDYTNHITGPVTITQRSSLVLDGHHITIKGMELDGALIVRTGDETYVTIDGLSVSNDGWIFEELDPTVEYPEMTRIRGYTMKRIQTQEYNIMESGHYSIDSSGTVKKL